jgi:glucuronoarabinoxylan endo-1,4-beta-xylanase
MRNRKYYLSFLIFLTSLGVYGLENKGIHSSGEKGITFDTKIRYQVIEGFGSCIVNYRDFPPEYAEPEFFNRVVNDLGLSIVRVPLMEHTEWINDDNDPDHFNWNGYWLGDNIDRKGLESSMNLMNEFKKHGVTRFMGTPWSPPDFLKTNRSPVQGGYLRADMFKEFAEYIAAQIILAKKNYGIDLNWVSVQNELLFAQFFRSCVYQPWVLKETVRALMHKFENEGINTRILMPEDMMFIDRMLYYIQPTMNDPETGSFNGHFSTHRRAGKDELQTWVNETNQFNRQNWMTETSGHDQTWEGALKMANDIQDYLVHGNFSAWIYWQLSGGGDGKFSIMVNGKPTVKYYASKHFYRYIRPGAIRIAATPENSNLFVSAFHNPYDGTLTSVIINNTDSTVHTTVNSKFIFDIYRSFETEQFKDLGQLKPGGLLSIPPKSIITLNAKNGELKTGEKQPELQESWKIPDGTSDEMWGNKNPFPGKRPFQVKPDGGNISIYPDLKESDLNEILNERLHNGWSLLHLTIMNGDGDAVKYLIDSGADINTRANDGWTPLHMAAATFAGNESKPNRVNDYSKYDIFKLVLDAQPNLHVTSDDGWTPLHAAVANAYTGWRGDSNHSLQRVKDLLNAGINLESKDLNGRTALHWASLQGYLHYAGVPSVKADVVTLLVGEGANIGAVDKTGKTPLHLAVEMGYHEIVLELMTAGADVKMKDKNGVTPLEIAKRTNNDTIIFILENGKLPGDDKPVDSNPQKQTESLKYGPELLKAAWEGDIRKVKELLEKGADTEYRDNDGFNALERARDNGHSEIVTLIMNSKIN